MSVLKKNLKICTKGHKFYKSSTCLTCPTCEKLKKPKTGFLTLISAPARRALEKEKITTLKKLSSYSEKEIKQLHGMGPNAISKLEIILKEVGLGFKIEKVNSIKLKNTKSEIALVNTKNSNPTVVDVFMKNLKHPMKTVIEQLRAIILKTHRSIGEEIKWNAPAFFYTGEMKESDAKEFKRYIVVFNFYKKDCIRLIFLSGAKLNDTTGFLEGDYSDGRRLANFYSLQDVKTNQNKLQSLIKKWLDMSI